MAMPETTVHEDNCLIFRQNNIRPSRQVGHIQAISVTKLPKSFPNEHLGFRVLSSDVRHAKVSRERPCIQVPRKLP